MYLRHTHYESQSCLTLLLGIFDLQSQCRRSIMSVTQVSRLLPIWNPVITTVRTRTRTPNIRKPAIPHWSRAVALKLTKPIYRDPEEDTHPRERCRKRLKAIERETNQVNPFEQILAKEFLERIENAKFIAVFHKLPITEAEMFAARLQLHKIKLEILKHNNTITRLAFMGTKYEALLNLYDSTNCTFIGDEPVVGKLLKLVKKIPGLVLLGGVVEGRFMCVQDLQRYANLPSLPTLHGQLASILSTPAQHLSQNLSANQMGLSSALSRYAADTKSDDDPEASSTP